MDTKEQLCREYTEWWGEYEKAHEKVSVVYKHWYEIQERGTIVELDKVLTDASSAFEDEWRVIVKLQEICNKLRGLPQ